MSLTTHVLDTAQGRPADGIAIDLYRIEIDAVYSESNVSKIMLSDKESNKALNKDKAELKTLIGQFITNQDGRIDKPLLNQLDNKVGQYELVFFVADYFKKQGVEQADPPFLDQVSIRFGIAEPSAHYHVPLLLSPWSYSTYRGS